jgi:hypothetical protein
MLHSKSIFFAEIIMTSHSLIDSHDSHRLDPPDVALRTCRHGILHLGHRVVLQDGVSDGASDDTELVEG